VIGKRIGAAVIDLLIGAIVWSVLFFGVFSDSADSSSSVDECSFVRSVGDDPVICFDLGDKLYATQGGDSLAVIALFLAAGFANHALLQGATGASVGKHLFGLRVIKNDTGQLASYGPNALRWLVGIFDIGCCFLIALIMILTTKGHRRLGDMAAKTLVVGTNSVGGPPVVPGLTGPQFTGGPYATSYPPAGSPFTPPQAASPTGWPPPTASTPPPSTPSAPVADAPAANTPTWDPQRNTYVIFDAAQNRWMQWDETSQQWRPISQ
jgi:uncharacterized RDD family membrane protein YckC